VGTDDYRETLWAIHPGGMNFYSLKDGSRLPVTADLRLERPP